MGCCRFHRSPQYGEKARSHSIELQAIRATTEIRARYRYAKFRRTAIFGDRFKAM